MSGKQWIVKWVGRAITVAIFSWYYVAVCTLCWLLATPDVANAMATISHYEAWSTLICWGVISGVFLCGHDVLMGGDKISRYVKGEGDRREAFAGLSDIAVGLSILLVPFFAVHYNLFLRATYPPMGFVLATALFLFKMTEHYYETATHDNVALTESIHA